MKFLIALISVKYVDMIRNNVHFCSICSFADDVQYCVMKSVPKIIVSWHVASEENDPRRTFVHAYQLATDYQMVSHILNIEPIDHYVSSLHNIEGIFHLFISLHK